MKFASIGLLLVLFAFVSPLQVENKEVKIGNTKVDIQRTNFGNSKAVFINVHSNETTSVAATKEYLQDRNGIFVELKHDTTRLIKFEWKGKLIQFDPNRMFTEKGRITNLRILNGKVPSGTEDEVEDFAQEVISKIKKAAIIIAVHNNTEGKPLSVNSFKEKYVNRNMDADDFILTTEKKIYDQLKKKKINAVLQTVKTSSDDGSLAIYCSKKKIPYINIEAQQEHKAEQLRMLNALTDIINQYTD
jgi:hypothetical protein